MNAQAFAVQVTDMEMLREDLAWAMSRDHRMSLERARVEVDAMCDTIVIRECEREGVL